MEEGAPCMPRLGMEKVNDAAGHGMRLDRILLAPSQTQSSAKVRQKSPWIHGVFYDAASQGRLLICSSWDKPKEPESILGGDARILP